MANTTQAIRQNVMLFVTHINTELQEQDGLLPKAYGSELSLSEGPRFFTLRGTLINEYQDRGCAFLRICKTTGNIYPRLGNSAIGTVLCRQEVRALEWNECIYSHHVYI